MKKGQVKAALLSCAAAFSFVSVPAHAQQAVPPAPATTAAPTPAQPTRFQPPALATDPNYEFQTKRIIRFSGAVNQESAERVIRQLSTLDELEPGKDITLIINSGGGGVTQGLAIISHMQSLRSKVNTVCQGEAQSMGAVILAAGTGTRTAYGDCLIMIHQVSNTMGGQLETLQNNLRLTERLNQRLVEILSRATGVPEADLRRAMSTDFRMTPAEAQSMGLIDSVVPVRHQPSRQPRRSIPQTAVDSNFNRGGM